MFAKALKEANSTRASSPSPSEDENLSLASPKRGRKESEQRRRVMMNQYFDELITLLSMLSERCIPKKMDKATTLHEAVQCIQIYSDLANKPERTLTLDVGKTPKSSSKANKPPSPVQQADLTSEGSVQGLHTVGELLHFFLDAHDAFLMVVSETGRVLYSTELITSLLGHMQTRLVGQNFFDFVHENDHKLFHDILKSDQQSGSDGVKLKDRPIIGFPPQLVQCHLRLYAGETGYFPQYLLFKTVVYLRKWDTERSKPSVDRVDLSPSSPPSSESSYSTDVENQACLVMIGKLPTSLSMVDLPVGTNDVNFEFEMRVSRKGRIIDIDKHAVTVIGYTSAEIIGTSFFDYVDPYHLLEVSEGMSTFLTSGLGTTTPYRLLTKGGRSIWLISKGYLSYNPWNNKPDHILLTNRVLGCDQVLPEHRFFRSRKLLPDLEGHECYMPTIPVSRSSPSPSPQANVTSQQPATNNDALPSRDTADSAGIMGHTPELQGQFDILGDLSHNHQGHQLPHYPTQMVTMQHHHQQQQQGPLPHHQGGSMGGQQQQPQIPHTPQSNPAVLSTARPPGAGGISSASGMSQNAPQVPSSTASGGGAIMTAPPPQSSALMSTSRVQSFEDIQRELDRKNREIFEMQRKLFEQQQLFEKERTQFYSITAQVMQCISSSTLNIPSNMQMAMTTANECNPSGMLSAPQTKTVDMGHPIQPSAHNHYSSDTVQSVNTPLWDNRTTHGSMDGFGTGSSQPYHLPQTHQAPPPPPPHTQQQHHHQQQMRQQPYSATPTSSLPTATDFMHGGSSSNVHVSSASQMPHSQLSEQFGLSQAFKMSGHHSLAEHNMQYYHHPPMPQQQSAAAVPVSQSTTHLESQSSTGFDRLLSNALPSNLSASLGSSINLPSLPVGMHPQQKEQQSNMSASQDLADILNSARYS